MRGAAETKAIEIAGKYCKTDDPGNRHVIDMVREGYIAGFEDGRKTNRRTT